MPALQKRTCRIALFAKAPPVKTMALGANAGCPARLS